MSRKTVISIGILEDNKEEQLLLENMLYELAEEYEINLKVCLSSTMAKGFIDEIASEYLNVCFLDIDLNDSNITGMDVAEKLDEMGKDIKIVFLTGQSSYMSKAFKVSAFDFLTKPLNREDLKRTLFRLNDKLKTGKECLEIVGQEFIRIPFKDIIYLQYEDRRVKVATVNSIEILPSTYTLKSITAKLPQAIFVDCSSNTCVNMDYVAKFNGTEVVLNINGLHPLKNEYGINGNKIYTSQSGTKRVRNFIRKVIGE